MATTVFRPQCVNCSVHVLSVITLYVYRYVTICLTMAHSGHIALIQGTSELHLPDRQDQIVVLDTRMTVSEYNEATRHVNIWKEQKREQMIIDVPKHCRELARYLSDIYVKDCSTTSFTGTPCRPNPIDKNKLALILVMCKLEYLSFPNACDAQWKEFSQLYQNIVMLNTERKMRAGEQNVVSAGQTFVLAVTLLEPALRAKPLLLIWPEGWAFCKTPIFVGGTQGCPLLSCSSSTLSSLA